MEEQAPRQRLFSGLRTSSGAPLDARTGGNENTGLIKLIAMACMIVDHVGAVFFPNELQLRVIGRMAFPLFVWCLCVGAEYTRNIWKYALRLLLVGALAQPMFMLGLRHQWYQLNIFATLLLGLLGIAAMRENKNGSAVWGPLLALLVSLMLQVDYNWQGVLFIFLLYMCRKQRSAIIAVMIAYCLYWGYGTFLVDKVLFIPIPKSVSWMFKSEKLFADVSRVQFWAVLATPLIAWPMRSRLRLPKWVSYAVHPAHLLVIGIIRNWGAITAFFNRLS